MLDEPVQIIDNALLAQRPHYCPICITGERIAYPSIRIKMLNNASLTTIRAVLILCASLATMHARAAVDCQKLGEATGGPDDNFRPPLSAHVVGVGRAEFYSAPASECMIKHLFIIPGDEVTVYKSYKNWYQVMYTNNKTGEDFEGWIEDRRLRLEGTVGGNGDQ
jgi:hypothetical protein